MNGHDLKGLSRRWFNDVWNHNKITTIDELMIRDCGMHGLHEVGASSGADQFKIFHGMMSAAFSQIDMRVEDVLLDGDKTAIRFTFHGTHSGNSLGVPPTGRRVRVTGIVIIRWQDGKIAEGWNEFDAQSMVAQIAPGPIGPAAKVKV